MKTTLFASFVAIALIAVIGWIAFSQIKEHHMQRDPKLDEIKRLASPLFDQLRFSGKYEALNTRDVLNEISIYKGDKSYTINKEKVFLCLLDENGEYYHINSLMYVFLHETAHVLCDEIGHTEKFHEIFQDLLLQAADLGIYNPNIPMISDYCTYND
jgi:hypothetical protein